MESHSALSPVHGGKKRWRLHVVVFWCSSQPPQSARHFTQSPINLQSGMSWNGILLLGSSLSFSSKISLISRRIARPFRLIFSSLCYCAIIPSGISTPVTFFFISIYLASFISSMVYNWYTETQFMLLIFVKMRKTVQLMSQSFFFLEQLIYAPQTYSLS